MKKGTVLFVYSKPLHHFLTLRACCATRVQFGGTHCNEDEVYHFLHFVAMDGSLANLCIYVRNYNDFHLIYTHLNNFESTLSPNEPR